MVRMVINDDPLFCLKDFPGIRIGPEPTTDRFIAVMNAESEGVIPGNGMLITPRHDMDK